MFRCDAFAIECEKMVGCGFIIDEYVRDFRDVCRSIRTYLELELYTFHTEITFYMGLRVQHFKSIDDDSIVCEIYISRARINGAN